MEKLERLYAWAKDHGTEVSAKVKFAKTEWGYGVLAEKRLDQGDIVCTCPPGLFIGPNLAKERFPGANINQLQTYVKLVLLQEAKLGEQSKWHPYLECLPSRSELGLPLFYSAEEMKSLKGTNIAADLSLKLGQLQEEYDVVIAKEDPSIEFEDYLWAHGIFTSRAFPARFFDPAFEDISMLVPVVDLLNHKPRQPVKWDINDAGFALVADAAVEEGSEVCNNYGPKSNEELLMGYGFAIPSNPFDRVALRLGMNIFPVIEAGMKTHFSIEPPKDLVFYLTRESPLSDALVAAFCVVAADIHDNEMPANARGITRLRGLNSLLGALQRKRSQLAPADDEEHSSRYYYVQGQSEILDAAIESLNGLIEAETSAHRAVDLTSLAETDPDFISAIVAHYDVGSAAELVEMQLEDEALLIYCTTGRDPSVHGPATLEALEKSDTLSCDMYIFENDVQRLYEEHPDLFQQELPSVESFALASKNLELYGENFNDAEGQLRFHLVL
ncbi:hypothetical protein TRVA0_050S01046 [Trichomonascus vanleenenianus]|uniref:SET domain-containing protein n=1 Tax=Trichomonascus vanleenenianus TaxID=2268995 RepID=UPI003EC95B34